MGHPLYRFFKTVFDPVLSPNHSADRNSGSYLAVAANEGALRSVFTEPTVNGGALLVGEKGIGKTTLLRNNWSYTMNPTVAGGCLRFGIQLDTEPKNDHADRTLAPYVKIAGDALVREYNLDDSTESLREYVEKDRPALAETMKLKEETFDEWFVETDLVDISWRYRLACARLKKLSLDALAHGLKRIEFAIDNVECQTTNWLADVLNDLSVLLRCLEKLNRPFETRLCLRVLLVCRPESWLNLRSTREWEHDHPWWAAAVHSMDQTGRFSELVRLRFQAASHTGLRDHPAFDLAQQRVMELVAYIDRVHGDLLMRLANRDIRMALELLVDVLRSQTHMGAVTSSAESEPGAFDPLATPYVLKDASVIRALFLHEATVYSSDVTRLPNVLATEPTGISDLAVFYILHFLGTRLPAGRSITWSEIAETILRVPPFICMSEDQIHRLVKTAEHHGLISRDQIGTSDDPAFALTSRGQALTSVLGESSVVLELLRDDLRLPIEYRHSFRPSLQLAPIDRFMASLGVVEWVMDVEAAHSAWVLQCNDVSALRIYAEYFNGSVGLYLLKGLRSSVGAYFHDKGDPNEKGLSEACLRLAEKHRTVHEEVRKKKAHLRPRK